MKVLFIIDEFTDLNVMFDLLELAHPPLKGDYLNILPFFEGENRNKVEEFLELNGKLTTASIYDRSWGKLNGEVVLMIHTELKNKSRY